MYSKELCEEAVRFGYLSEPEYGGGRAEISERGVAMNQKSFLVVTFPN